MIMMLSGSMYDTFVMDMFSMLMPISCMIVSVLANIFYYMMMMMMLRGSMSSILLLAMLMERVMLLMEDVIAIDYDMFLLLSWSCLHACGDSMLSMRTCISNDVVALVEK